MGPISSGHSIEIGGKGKKKMGQKRIIEILFAIFAAKKKG
jgi:hypothetical protein